MNYIKKIKPQAIEFLLLENEINNSVKNNEKLKKELILKKEELYNQIYNLLFDNDLFNQKNIINDEKGIRNGVTLLNIKINNCTNDKEIDKLLFLSVFDIYLNKNIISNKINDVSDKELKINLLYFYQNISEKETIKLINYLLLNDKNQVVLDFLNSLYKNNINSIELITLIKDSIIYKKDVMIDFFVKKDDISKTLINFLNNKDCPKNDKKLNKTMFLNYHSLEYLHFFYLKHKKEQEFVNLLIELNKIYKKENMNTSSSFVEKYIIEKSLYNKKKLVMNNKKNKI